MAMESGVHGDTPLGEVAKRNTNSGDWRKHLSSPLSLPASPPLAGHTPRGVTDPHRGKTGHNIMTRRRT
jgi:hypothetical protein